jgi:hypothetical protein
MRNEGEAAAFLTYRIAASLILSQAEALNFSELLFSPNEQ